VLVHSANICTVALRAPHALQTVRVRTAELAHAPDVPLIGQNFLPACITVSDEQIGPSFIVFLLFFGLLALAFAFHVQLVATLARLLECFLNFVVETSRFYRVSGEAFMSTAKTTLLSIR
jgi:hypothetical protein